MKIWVMRDGQTFQTEIPDLTPGEVSVRDTLIRNRKTAREAKISALAFFARFTNVEKVAIQTAAQTNAIISVGLTHGLAAGTIDLLSIDLENWMELLVQAGSITSNRKTEIMAIN